MTLTGFEWLSVVKPFDLHRLISNRGQRSLKVGHLFLTEVRQILELWAEKLSVSIFLHFMSRNKMAKL